MFTNKATTQHLIPAGERERRRELEFSCMLLKYVEHACKAFKGNHDAVIHLLYHVCVCAFVHKFPMAAYIIP